MFVKLWVTQSYTLLEKWELVLLLFGNIGFYIKYVHNLGSNTSTPIFPHCRDTKICSSKDIHNNVYYNTIWNTPK